MVKKAFIGIEMIKGVKSALFYNYDSGETVIAIPMKQIKKALNRK